MENGQAAEKKGLLYELADGYRIDLTEEEYNEKLDEIRAIAKRLHVNMDVLDVVEKSYRTRLIILSMVSRFGFDRISGRQLLEASGLTHMDEPNDMKQFFMKVGWTPYYLEYEFAEKLGTEFHDLIDYFFDDVELYMDMSENLEYVRVPNALRIV